MIDTLLSRGCNSVATASILLSIVSLLVSCKNEFPESVESLISMEPLNLNHDVRVIYAVHGIMKCMFRKMFAEFITGFETLNMSPFCLILQSEIKTENHIKFMRFI